MSRYSTGTALKSSPSSNLAKARKSSVINEQYLPWLQVKMKGLTCQFAIPVKKKLQNYTRAAKRKTHVVVTDCH